MRTGREERHRSVKVQHGRHRTNDGDGPDKEKGAVRCHAGQTMARRREQSIFVGNEANQQESGHENERCPVLGGRRPGRRWVQRSCYHQSGEADNGEAPTKQTLTVAARFQGRGVVVYRLRIDRSPKVGR
jgi:hypothetical protein